MEWANCSNGADLTIQYPLGEAVGGIMIHVLGIHCVWIKEREEIHRLGHVFRTLTIIATPLCVGRASEVVILSQVVHTHTHTLLVVRRSDDDACSKGLDWGFNGAAAGAT